MVKLVAINFTNKKGKKIIFDIPEELRVEFENHCATSAEEVSCAGGMFLGVAFETQEHLSYIPPEMCMIFEYNLGVLKKKIALSGGGSNDAKEILKMESLKFTYGEVEKIFYVPSNMKIYFGKETEDEQEVADSAGKLFVKLILDEVN